MGRCTVHRRRLVRCIALRRRRIPSSGHLVKVCEGIGEWFRLIDGFFRVGQFMSAFASQENGGNVSNPFSNGVNWSNGNNNGQPQPFANPFQEAIKTNGFSANFKTAFPINPMPINGANSTWTPNPFKVTLILSFMIFFLRFVCVGWSRHDEFNEPIFMRI